MVLLDLPMSRSLFYAVRLNVQASTPNIAERTRDMAVMRSLVANGFGFSVANIRPHSDLSPDGRDAVFYPPRRHAATAALGLRLPRRSAQRSVG